VRRSPTCAVLHVSSLLHELVLEAVRLRELRASDALHRSLRDLIASQLRSAPEVPISVRLPTDQGALRFSQNFISTLDNSTLLTEACRVAGVGIRTMERIFQNEVGMSLESWRRQVRLMKTVELLVEGCPVKRVAAEVGYRQPSAFIELFRDTLGVTPRVWAASLGKSSEA
jgi:transcriptional regulator GlxA family with amidase domain